MKPRVLLTLLMSSAVIAVTALAGFFELTSGDPQASAAECFAPKSASLLSEIRLVANVPAGAGGPRLEAGAPYLLIAKGTFSYNAAGDTADAKAVLIDGKKIFGGPEATQYCADLKGAGKAPTFTIGDPNVNDNAGYIEIAIYRLPD
jgi:hypothetical protein